MKIVKLTIWENIYCALELAYLIVKHRSFHGVRLALDERAEDMKRKVRLHIYSK